MPLQQRKNNNKYAILIVFSHRKVIPKLGNLHGEQSVIMSTEKIILNMEVLQIFSYRKVRCQLTLFISK